MKSALYILFITAFFLSCKSNTKQETKNITTIKPDNRQTERLIEKFKPIIQGVWIKKDYIDKVIATKSPLASAKEAKGITTMYVNTDLIKGDSLIVEVGWGNHEGGDIRTKFKSGKQPSTLIFTDYSSAFELGYSIEKNDTSLILYQANEKTKQISKTKYVKALNKQPSDNLGYGMDYLINKGLISGNYILIDSTGVQNNIIFTDDGKTSGIPGFKTYYVENDFVGEPMNNLDGIIFNIYTKNQSSYSFRIKKDTLNLYETHPNSDSSELILGKCVYKLVKQK